MKFFVFVSLLAGLSAAAAASGLGWTPDGAITVDGLSFAIQHRDDGWRITGRSRTTFEPAAGYPKNTPAACEWRGVFRTVSGGEFTLAESMVRSEPETIDYQARLTHPAGLPTRLLAFTANLAADSSGRLPRLDGRQFGFGEHFDEKNWKLFFPARNTTLEIPLPHGILTVTGNFAVRLQDDRKFNLGRWVLWLLFSPDSGELRDTSLKLRFSYRTYRSAPLDLSGSANMGFADGQENDGRGGWTDQGPANDLRMMTPGRKNLAGVGFHVLDPASNRGRSCLALRGRNRPVFPLEAAVPANGADARYLYLFHASAWEAKPGTPLGEIVAMENDGTEHVIPLESGRDVGNFWNPVNRANAAVVWNAANGSARIGLYLSRFKLPGKPLRELRFRSAGNAVWMIVSASLSNDLIELPRSQPVYITADAEWRPIRHKFPVRPGSAIDFSGLLDAPAGKYGFIRNDAGRFRFETGPRAEIRFYGANICQEALFIGHADADRLAENFAATGYNLARLHQDDHRIHSRRDGRTTGLDSEKQERLDYLFAALKKRGIYLTIDLYARRVLLPGEIPEFPERSFDIHSFKALPFLLDSAMKNWEEAAANRLNHVNPYTGLAWKDDPALVSICLLNEDTLYAVWNRDPDVQKLCLDRFAGWVKENRIEFSESDRPRLMKRFLSELHAAGYARMSAFLRRLGVKALLTDQNYWNNVSLALNRSEYDLVDTHFYWGHPEFHGKDWSLPATVANDCAVNRFGGALAAAFGTRLFGAPFTVTEWDFVTPGAYTAEGAFLTGAYAALQQWGGLCRFTYTHDPARIRSAEHRLHLFDTAGDPLRSLSERAGALFFLRGDVRPAAVSFPVLVSTDYLKRPGNPEYHPAAVERLGLIGRVGVTVYPAGGTPALPADAAAALVLEPELPSAAVPLFTAGKTLEAMLAQGILTPEEADLRQGRFTSRTGELVLNSGEGVFTVSTARSEGFVLPAGKSAAGTFAEVHNRRGWASFLVGSIDGQPLDSSRRLLLLHLTELKNSHMKFGDRDMTLLEEWGTLPLLMRSGQAELVLKRDFAGFRLYALDFDGSRLFELPLSAVSGRTGIVLDNFRNGFAVAAYELVQE